MKNFKLYFFFNTLVVILLLPLFLMVLVTSSLVLLLFQSGSVFYISQRIGENEKIFNIIKFRTMFSDAPIAEKNEFMVKYVTPIGGIYRKLSLDEIPQILNILNGTMSLIGPRPCLKGQTDLVRLRRERMLFQLKPGITGLAQVKGRDNLTLRQKVRYEEFYFKNKSAKLDLLILFWTVKVLITKKGNSY